MARRRIKYDDFRNGLWVTGSRDTVPLGYLRRAKGLHQVPMRNIRSRDGDVFLYARDAHSLFRFGDARYQGVGLLLYKNGTTSLFASLNPTHLSALRMAPTSGIADYLFITGGGVMKKISTADAVTNWGIVAPPDGFTAALSTRSTKTIDLLDNQASNYTAAFCTLTNEGTITQAGGSLKMAVAAASTIGTATRTGLTLDLSKFTTAGDSADEDFIDLWIRFENSSNIDYCAIKFDVVDGSFAANYYTFKIFPTPDGPSQQPGGVGDISGADSAAGEEGDSSAFGGGDGGVVGADASAGPTGDAGLGPSESDTAFAANASWTHIQVSRSMFSHDALGTETWSTVKGIQLLVKTNDGGAATVYWDEIKMTGGAGMSGEYGYRVTFRNSVTGTRSNPNPTTVRVTGNNRQPIDLAGLPISTDPQVNQREIWRTIGNQVRLWRCAVINDNTTTTFTDRVADYVGLDGRPSSSVLEATELPLDNLPPDPDYQDTYGPWNGRAWWCRDVTPGSRGLVYYSPAGRAEAVQGFIHVTSDDDPTQKGVIWNGVNWVFTEEHIFRIDNTTEPFISREVFGAPGTTRPQTVIATPYGVCYQANDTIRKFNGLIAEALFPDAILEITRGSQSEGLGPFVGTVAAYANDEYIISNGFQTLACNLRTGRWRDMGVGCTALFHESDTNEVLATIDGAVMLLEEAGAPARGLDFEVKLPTTDFGTVPIVVERIFLDSETGTDTLSMSANFDNTSVPITSSIAHPNRSFNEFVVDRLARLVDVEIRGTLSSRVNIYSVDFEVRDVPMYVLENGRFFLVQGQVLQVIGNLTDVTTGITYYGIEEAISLMNVVWKPEIRRLYVDANTHGETITPVCQFYNSTRTLAPYSSSSRHIIEWDVNEGDRLVSVHLGGDFRNIQIYQVAIDVQIGEAL